MLLSSIKNSPSQAHASTFKLTTTHQGIKQICHTEVPGMQCDQERYRTHPLEMYNLAGKMDNKDAIRSLLSVTNAKFQKVVIINM